jgi:hypothetical protein
MADLDRRALILGEIDPARMRGLEIGALNKPLVRKSDGDIRYVDWADTETIKAKGYDSSIDPDDIVEVDIVWAAQPLSEAVGRPVDYIVASHVIEHAPDVLGWLHDLAGALKPDGLLALAVPDKRYSFDLRRNPSTLGEVIEAFVLEYRRPSIRQVVDQTFNAVVVDIAQAWREDLSGAALPKLAGDDEALEMAYGQARLLRDDPRYLDTHCWVFTPQTFLTLLDLLAQLRLLPFRVVSFTTTPRDTLEFYVRLRKTDPEAVDEIRASIRPHLAGEPSGAERLIAAMAGSSSCRLTAPLRAVRRRLVRR